MAWVAVYVFGFIGYFVTTSHFTLLTRIAMEDRIKNLTSHRILLIAVLVLVSPVISGCGSEAGVEGTYSGMRGTEMIELRSGGKAVFTIMGSTYPCTYNVDANKLTLDCNPKGVKRGFTIHDDGSLSDEVTIGEGRFTGGKWRKIK